ncbi:Sugar transporter family protein [Spironucleus salmonicida]|uniref:Sugar (And other) transporter family protein n=1 Tax=Spironucleus salmonicida TaxID=348837 RepID=V6LR16_9EUKA|nr:Sugar transporter family protein [Spironucleus salmonicida]|eukprot:EST43199.1 Sugar (and other) transporter family protein [Spironucleus salmonicida]
MAIGTSSSFVVADGDVQTLLPYLSIASLVGFLLASLTFAPIVSWIGYKKTGLVGAAGAAIFNVLLCIPFNVYYWLVMRLFAGYFVVLFQQPSIIIVGEHAEASKRGLLGVMFQFNVTLGILVASLVLLAIRTYQDTYNAWWINFIVTLIWPLMGFVLLFFVPDVKPREEKEISPMLLFKEKKYFKVLILSVMLGLNQQCTGINAVIVYATETFKDTFKDSTGKTHALSSVFGSIIINGVNFVATLGALAFIEKLGRKILLFGGVGICFAAQVALMINYIITAPNTATPNTALLITASIVFIIGFEIGPGPIFFVFASELFPVEVKSLLSSILLSFNYIPNIFVVVLFPILTKAAKWSPFVTYLIVMGVTTAVLLFTTPETKGKTQEEIQMILTGSAPAASSEAEKGSEVRFGSGVMTAE